MKPLRLSLCLLGLGAGILATPALARPPCPPPDGPMMQPGMPMPGEPEPMPPYLRGVQLNDGQRDQVFQIMHRAAPALRGKGQEAGQAQRALHELSLSANYDEAKAKTLADAGARAMAEIALMQAAIDNQIVRLLTPDQRKQIDSAKPDNDRPHPQHRMESQ